ncbi:MAG TPA: penicillin-binding protein 2 [Chloroflexota bacterium]
MTTPALTLLPRRLAGRLGRRQLLGLLALGSTTLSLAACAGGTGLKADTATVAQSAAAATPLPPTPVPATATPVPPTPTPLPTNTPQGATTAFLTAWATQDYPTMYTLLSQEAQATITKDAFVTRYAAIWDVASIISLSAKVLPTEDVHSPTQRFHVTMQTALVGTIDEDNTAALIQEGDRWLVQWLPSLIFKDLAGANLIHMTPKSLPRGEIVDSKGAKVATQTTYTNLGLVPGTMKDVPGTLAAVSKALNYPLPQLQALYDKAKTNPTWLQPVQIVQPDQLAAVQAALKSTPGILFSDEPLRGYPQKDLAAQSIGYLGEISADELKTKWQDGYLSGDWIGRTGLEHWGETTLAGKRGGELAVVTPDGTVFTVIAQRAPLRGSNIVLTLDMALQKVAQDAMGKLNGSVAVMRISDGSLLALASAPSFDANSFILGLSQAQAQALFQNANQPLNNRPTLGAYPAGSTFKTVTMSSALGSSMFGPSSMFTCTGVWNGLGIPMHCWKIGGHGNVSLTEGLAQSCDIVFYEVGHTLDGKGHTVFPDLAKGFGVGETTGIVGLVEAAGLLPTPTWKQQTQNQPWYPGDPVNLAIGQGSLLVTPLQMVSWIAAIANGGTLWTPRVVDKVLAPTGEQSMPAPVKQRGTLPVSADELASVRAAMRRVIDETDNWLGTGSWAFRDFPIAVAGKTGTAQSGQAQPHAWFASFAPADKPEIAIVAMAEHAGEGADVAGPISRAIYEAYFKTPWQPHVQPGVHQSCTTTEYLCPAAWPRVVSSVGNETYRPT